MYDALTYVHHRLSASKLTLFVVSVVCVYTATTELWFVGCCVYSAAVWYTVQHCFPFIVAFE